MVNESTPLIVFLQDFFKELAQSDYLYKQSLYSDQKIYLIPFFGKIETAKVITVGINPASSEFRPSRNWPPERQTLTPCAVAGNSRSGRWIRN